MHGNYLAGFALSFPCQAASRLPQPRGRWVLPGGGGRGLGCHSDGSRCASHPTSGRERIRASQGHPWGTRDVVDDFHFIFAKLLARWAASGRGLRRVPWAPEGPNPLPGAALPSLPGRLRLWCRGGCCWGSADPRQCIQASSFLSGV